jgi:hypothetical protein
MSRSWSRQIEARYHLRLPADLRAWFDDEVWRVPGGAEFCQIQSPDQFMDPEPGVVWAGFMLPNTLPLIGNGYGDWLCLCVDYDGAVTEILHWSHGGGDWLPHGRSLAEALLYDAAAQLLFPQRHEFLRPEPEADQSFRLAEWARHWVSNVGRPLDTFWEFELTDTDRNSRILQTLADANVAEVPRCRDRVEQHLSNPFRQQSRTPLANNLDIPWEPDFVRWMFDTSAIPSTARDRLVRVFDMADEQLFAQDWAAAAQEAVTVTRQRTDMGWPFDIAGWQAERLGDRVAAAEFYAAGARASLFSDETVRFRTHWYDEGLGKFAAARLGDLMDVLSDEQRRDPYLQIFWKNDATTLKDRLCEYWLQQAWEAERAGQWRNAYGFFYRAGWDLGLASIADYEDVFKGLARTAQSADCLALASIAELHQRSLHLGR